MKIKAILFPIANAIFAFLCGAFVKSTFDISTWGVEYKTDMVTYLAIINLLYGVMYAVHVLMILPDQKKTKENL